MFVKKADYTKSGLTTPFLTNRQDALACSCRQALAMRDSAIGRQEGEGENKGGNRWEFRIAYKNCSAISTG